MDLRARVRERLRVLGLNPNEAAIKGGFKSRQFISELVSENSKKNSVHRSNLIKLAKALDCSVEYLTGQALVPGKAPGPYFGDKPGPGAVTVIGRIEEGTYRSSTHEDRPARYEMLGVDQRFRLDDQVAFTVEDGSLAHLGVTRDSFIISVPFDAFRAIIGPISPGNVLVLRLSRDDGREFSLVAREVRDVSGGSILLRSGPRSIEPGEIIIDETLKASVGRITVDVVGVALRSVRLI